MLGPNEITVLQLNRLIGTPKCPVIVDICLDEDFNADPHLIPGSFRHSHTDIPGLSRRLDGRRAVIACQKGLKLSQGVVAWLQSAAVEAKYLQGGVFGWRAARDTLRVDSAVLPDMVADNTLWVTRQRPGINQIACAWLIRRFIDRDARLLFVAPDQVNAVADRFAATVFGVDSPNPDKQTAMCTFQTMLSEFGLNNAALQQLADVVQGASAHQKNPHPAAAGFRALLCGLSRQYHDDHTLLAPGIAACDALYHWARDSYDDTPKRNNGKRLTDA